MTRTFLLPVALVVVAACLAGCGGSSSPTQPSGPAYVIPASELAEMVSDKVMGDPAAPVTVVGYSSVTCPHCATFHLSTLPSLKAAYIDTDKVKFVARDYPVNGASNVTAAYAGAALARCAGNARYFDALDLLYRSQGTWTASSNPTAAMKQALAPLGLASDKMDACVASAEIRSAIDKGMAEARTNYGLRAVPTVVVNGQVLVGPTYAEIDAVLKGLGG